MLFWTNLGRWITKVAAALAMVALLVMMVVVVANVIGRGLFSSPLLGTVEIVGLAGVFLISFAIGLTEADRAHVTVMILLNQLSPRLQSFFTLIRFLLCVGITVLLFWAGALQLWESVVRPDMVTPVLRVPKAPFVIVWMCGCVFLLGYLLKNLADKLIEMLKK